MDSTIPGALLYNTTVGVHSSFPRVTAPETPLGIVIKQSFSVSLVRTEPLNSEISILSTQHKASGNCQDLAPPQQAPLIPGIWAAAF